MPAVSLLIRTGPRAGQQIPLRNELIVGREAGADLVLDDPGVSRRHLSVRLERGAVVAEDLGSSNGTFVNGHRVTGPVELAGGDELRLGDTVITPGGLGAAPAVRQPAAVPRRLGPPPHEEGLPALAAVFLGPLSIFLLVISYGAAFFVSLPCGIAAFVLGNLGIRRGGPRSQRALARIGRTSGIIGTVLSALALVVFVVLAALPA